MSYRKIYETIKAYEPKRLIGYRYQNTEGRCAIGVLLAKPEEVPNYHIDDLYRLRAYTPKVLQILEDFKCTIGELNNLQDYNDRKEHKTPEERYLNVLDYLQERVDQETS